MNTPPPQDISAMDVVIIVFAMTFVTIIGYASIRALWVKWRSDTAPGYDEDDI